MNTLKRNGFTIVELLIVVVVIAILAAITIVAYNGIQNRAKESALQSAVSQAGKKIATHSLTNSETLPLTAGAAGVNDTADAQYTYIPNGTNGGYCISANRPSSDMTVAFSSTKGGTGTGTCITNRVTNPSVEQATLGWGTSINSSTTTLSPTAALFGNQGLLVTTSSTSDSGVSIPTTGTYTAGSTYSVSVRIKAMTAAQYSLSVQGTAGSSNRTTRTLAAGEEATLRFTWSPTTTGGIALYALRQGGQSGTATFYVDGAVMVDGSTAYAYNSSSDSMIIWTGAVGNSANIIPADQL